MIDAFIKALNGTHIVDCVAEWNHAKEKGDKLKMWCYKILIDMYNNRELRNYTGRG
jgi:hypothetical protein